MPPRIKLLHVVCAGLACSVLGNVPCAGQTLEDAVQAALRANPQLLAERARLGAVRSQGTQARAAGRPQVSAGATYEVGTGDYSLGPNGEALLGEFLGPPSAGEPSDEALALGGQGGQGRFQTQIGVVQPLFTGFRIRNDIERADAATRAAEARLSGAAQDTVVEAVAAYLDVVAQRARLEAAIVSAERLATAARAATVRFETGRATRTDIALAEARAAQARGRIASAEAALAAARAGLQAVTGLELTGVGGEGPAPQVPGDVETAIDIARASSPALAAANAEVAAREAALRVAKGRRAPTLQARAAASYAEDQLILGDELTAFTLTAELSVPIFEGGAITAEIREARARLRAERHLREQVRRRLDADVRATFAQHRAALAIAEAAEARAEAAALAARGAAVEREVGRRSVLDQLLAEQDLAEARFEAIDAKASRMLAAYRLRRAMGNLLTGRAVSGQAQP